ncbi:hypothetical protein [Ktedonospora formicarum]|uniref:hypothetical protein n=1 Tax=Ktedonospora formicarum TaxID=2778364 RepID=UPI001C68A782|nr:hypothetical protein [Ktedonospora formicarum]
MSRLGVLSNSCIIRTSASGGSEAVQILAGSDRTPGIDEASKHALAHALPAEAVSLLPQGVSPTDLPRQYHKVIFHIVQLGPYVRYRWREDAHTYTISLGLLNDYLPFPFTP